MYPISAEYREAIQLHRTNGVRNRSYAEIYVGEFDDSARGDAALRINDQGTYYSDFANVNTDTLPGGMYATWENDLFTLDGTQRLLPESMPLLPQGFTSDALSGQDGTFAAPITMTVQFGGLHSMVGLTLLFNSVSGPYASGFTVTTYMDDTLVETHEIENDSPKYEGILTLALHNKIVISFEKLSAPYQRLRLEQIVFGIGFVFGSDEIIDVRLSRSGSPISLELPQNKLQFTLFNENGLFDIDSGSAIMDFFNEDQEVTASFGYDVGDGKIEWVSGGKFWLDTWAVDGIHAKFTAIDIIARMTKGVYRKGTYGAKTARDIVRDIMADFGYANYDVSPYQLWNTYIENPMPVASHAECLQLIANYSMCRLEAVDGEIVFRSGAAPVPVYYFERPVTAPVLPYSDIDSVFDSNPDMIDYATWEQDFFALDGEMKLLPESGTGYIGTGVAYDVFPNGQGAYRYDGQRLGFTIDFVNNVTFGVLTINFGGHYKPKSILLNGIRDVDGGYEYVYVKRFRVTSDPFVITDYFDRIVWLYVCIEDDDKMQRARLQKIDCSWNAGVSITKDDIIGNSVGERKTLCRNLIVPLRNLVPETAAEIKKATVTAGIETWIEHGDAYSDVAVTTATEGAVLTYTAYAYATSVTVTGVTGDVEVVLTGCKLVQQTEDVRTAVVNLVGEDCVVENPLISASSIKEGFMDWMRAYLNRNIQWKAETLGYPELQPGDIIAFKGSDASITDCELSFAQAFREKFTVRKAGES